jgi:hypothetical protein
MHAVLARARRARDMIASATPLAQDNVWRFDGQVWTLGFGGRTINIQDAKGLHDLRLLLSQPGSAVSVEHLIDPANGSVSRGVRSDPTLDEQARIAYRKRLEELEGAILVVPPTTTTSNSSLRSAITSLSTPSCTRRSTFLDPALYSSW